MTDSERLWTGVAISLFLHFLLTLWEPAGETERNTFQVHLDLNMESSALAEGGHQGTGMESALPDSEENTRQLDRKRRAYLRYIEDIDQAIHAARLTSGDSDLIGVALCAFTIQGNGTFSDIRIASSSGKAALDASALRAVRATSGVIRRPGILGSDPIHVSLQVKYQYDLE